MKIFIYIIIAVFMLSILVLPMVEVFMLGREKILLSSTLYNSFRVARESSYSYKDMRELNAVVNKKAFLKYFSDTFATSYGMYCVDPTASPLKFKSLNNAYEDFEVIVNFKEESEEGGAGFTVVTITAKSEYKFKTAFMQKMSSEEKVPFVLQKTQTYNMKVVN